MRVLFEGVDYSKRLTTLENKARAFLLMCMFLMAPGNKVHVLLIFVVLAVHNLKFETPLFCNLICTYLNNLIPNTN